ncbi:hypothetical protein [Amycolatopsis sp. NPDC059657]|uniref:hypothetical protein n=1 Tax=Amycolatopsis sp. NPDC059657 TaxID=3346899 RepID=UPI00366F8541
MADQKSKVTRETIELVNALRAVTGNISGIADALLIGQMSTTKQHEYATLLRELADLLDTHADDQDGPTDA